MRLILYLCILGIGILIGYNELGIDKLKRQLLKIQNISLLFLLFVMGIRIGADKKVITSFAELGYQAIVISSFSILFSIILVKFVRGFVTKGNDKEEMKNEC
ncbi:LysO family transporter [Caldisalinibacter kiritimatiensis]|uniref:DUF340 domain-containing protein n=1 Tax=Caldisalinibacter kiritimatiensis TaxID=1304284 RepID=R1CCC0_9FIRM|nr:LysO family transporter [Caldisalinibacter kiritimatiensis]EOC99944.1 hypothetical protein L21TH_1989 [Caldisalinibacter kiritimatiensis]